MNTKILIGVVFLIGVVLMGAYSFGLFRSNTVKPYVQNTTTNSDSETNSWQEQTIDEVGLTFKMPPGTTFRKEIADDGGRIRILGFYVENNDKDNPWTAPLTPYT